jgi:hypothetical protein
MADDTKVAGGGPIRAKALVLYDGVETPHRSCGIALAETFDRPTAAYQSLRRGGITGTGRCGAVVAGQLLLGELLGDPDPTGKVTPALKQAMNEYEKQVATRIDRGNSETLICNDLTRQHGDFFGPARHRFCTNLVGTVAQVLDGVLQAHGLVHQPTAFELSDGTQFDPRAGKPEGADD